MTSSQHEIFVGARPEYYVWGRLAPQAWRAQEREPITGVWERSPQRGPGAELLVGCQGGKALKPSEAENLLASGYATEAANLPHSVRTLTLSK